MDFDSVALDVCSMAGPLEVRLKAAGSRGFRQVVLSAADLASHPQGVEMAVRMVRESGIKVLALKQLEDFEGHAGPLHEYKVHVAQGLLTLCHRVGAQMLLVKASAAPDAGLEPGRVARDLAKLSTLAVPKGIRVTYQATPGSTVAADLFGAEEVVNAVERANFGLALDTGHLFTSDGGLNALDRCYLDQLFLVELCDLIRLEHAAEERHLRVLPGDGACGDEIVELIRRLRVVGFHGAFCLSASNDDYAQLPADFVAERAMESLRWLLALLRHVDLPRRRGTVVRAAHV
ncbi:MAG: TIM barrel protein [Thauera sp.]|nr:TIM barrel protein [Thauera sp.]